MDIKKMTIADFEKKHGMTFEQFRQHLAELSKSSDKQVLLDLFDLEEDFFSWKILVDSQANQRKDAD